MALHHSLWPDAVPDADEYKDLRISLADKEFRNELYNTPPPQINLDIEQFPVETGFAANLLRQAYTKAEEDCVKQVLLQLLSHEPTLEDAARTQKIYNSKTNGYVLAYDYQLLGTINTYYDGPKAGVRFSPLQ